MGLNQRRYAPFDRTYADVTARIESAAGRLGAPDSDWLRRLIVAFQQERNLWDARPELTQYRQRWGQFRSRILWLVAGAYLHIGYDLPRALADEWPGTGGWSSGPDLVRGREIYFGLRAIFPESLVRSSRDLKTVGLTGIFAHLASRDALFSASIWVDNLRQGAWLHADILAAAHDRPAREAKMATAITASLEDASLFYPWSVLRLGPPHDAFFAPTWTVLLTALLAALPLLGNMASVAILASFLTKRILDSNRELRSIGMFVYVWGGLLNDYVAMAVREPQGFEDYRRRRQEELGLRRVAGDFA